MPPAGNLLLRATSGAAPTERSCGGLARLLPGAPTPTDAYVPVLRTSRCGGLGCLAAAIVEGGCDIESAVGRLVDDVELPQCRGDVVGFEVDELAGEAPFEVGDLGFDLAGAHSPAGGSSTSCCGGGFPTCAARRSRSEEGRDRASRAWPSAVPSWRGRPDGSTRWPWRVPGRRRAPHG